MKISPLAQKVTDIIGPSVTSMGYTLVLVRVLEGKKNRVLQIMAEREDGTMALEDCELVSRRVSALLDVEDPIDGAYNLEVSSPGLDRPLVTQDDYHRFTGRDIKLESVVPVDGRRRFKGVLKDVTAEKVMLKTVEGQDVVIEFDNINFAQLLITEAMVREELKSRKHG